MTKCELQEQLNYIENEYYTLYSKVEELRSLIIEGNRETNKAHMPSKSVDIYEDYRERLKEKIEELANIKIDFGYYSFY